MDDKRLLLRHFLAALAYRTQKALRDAPETFSGFRAAPSVRTPHELVRHMESVLGYARTFFIGGEHRPEPLPDFRQEILRFHATIEDLAHHLETGTPMQGITAEQMLQGPFSDAMTHAGQLALLRRLSGSPVAPENFIYAAVRPDNLGPEQPLPLRPGDRYGEWVRNNENRQPEFPSTVEPAKIKDRLSDNLVVLRRYRDADAPLLFEAVRESIPEISRWMDWCHTGYSIEESFAWLASRDEAWMSGTEYGFAITDAQTGILLGGVGLNFIRREIRAANLGYWVRTDHAGRGVATAATILTARFGFQELGLTRMEIVAAVGNLASQRVAEKAGAKREGVLRNRLVIKGQRHDALMFSLIPEDMKL